MRLDEISINLKREYLGMSFGTMRRLGTKEEKAAKETGRVSGEDGRKPRDHILSQKSNQECISRRRL